MGEQIEVEPMRMNVGGSLHATRGGSAWLFTPIHPESWLNAPLRSMLSALRNTWILLDTDRVDRDVLDRLRPPVPPKLKRGLEALDWSVADYQGRDGGRMTREEFLEEVAGQPWLRFHHDSEGSKADIESWHGSRLLGGWTVSIREHFRLALPWKRPHGSCRALDWQVTPRSTPFETVISLFLLDDPYELLRFFVIEEHGFDPDLLGPQTVWKDIPDMLEEFSDEHDGQLANLHASVAHRLNVDETLVSKALDPWFHRIARDGCMDFPTLGDIRRIELPQVRIPRPIPLARAQPGDDVIVSPGSVHAATALPASTWVKSVTPKRKADEISSVDHDAS
jgi:hypothetical protein